MRTQDEIVARIGEVEASGRDWMGSERTNLVEALDYEHAKPWLKPEIEPAQWTALTEEQLREAAHRYFEFAFGKAEDHRGLSAGRSIDHFSAWVWLLCSDEDFAAFEAASYENYGVPKLVKARDLLGATYELTPSLQRMSEGLECDPTGCDGGCGS